MKWMLRVLLLLLLLFNFILTSQVLFGKRAYFRDAKFFKTYIRITLQKCLGACNKKYCVYKPVCRPINRTSKLTSSDIYFHPGVIVKAPVYIEVIANKKFTTVYRQHMLKIKAELCHQLEMKDHPLWKHYITNVLAGNILDPCPFTGHRYMAPQISSYSHFPLVPVGEWRMDYIISINVNDTEEIILSWFDFYEVKPTSAIEF